LHALLASRVEPLVCGADSGREVAEAEEEGGGGEVAVAVGVDAEMDTQERTEEVVQD